VGHYRPGFEPYGELFKVGELKHNSCLILTSREKPKDIAAEGKLCRCDRSSLEVAASTDGRVVQAKGNFSGSEQDWQTLIQSYAGNPLALFSTTIHDLFAGYLKFYLKERSFLVTFKVDQFNRLSELEQ